MSDFLMVVPEGWTEIFDVEGVFQSGDSVSVQSWITGQTWWELENALEVSNQLPLDVSVWDAKLFNTGSEWKLWVKFGPMR